MDQHSNQVVATRDVIGKNVVSPQQENLGSIEEIVLDKVAGETRYVVLSFGGILGLGDKLFALPWKSISYDPGQDAFILNVEKDRLKEAPGFNKDNWPDFANETWRSSINDFYF
jgi:sporulation protein YlmC with PRC-barrel domain